MTIPTEKQMKEESIIFIWKMRKLRFREMPKFTQLIRH